MRAAAILLVVAGLWGSAASGADDALAARGAEIYLHGRIANGGKLEGRREAGRPPAHGEDAACVNCHRHSGLGVTEGRIHIPPVTGRFLMPPHYDGTDRPRLPYIENMHGGRKDYTEATLAEAIRSGTDADGKVMSALMPRYALDDADMAALLAYLKSMDRSVEPGVTPTVLHFATILTPDADPLEKQATLSVLRQFVKDQNEKAFLVGPAPTVRASGQQSVVRMLALSPRRWELHVWELSGPAQTWREQLDAFYRREPVLAVLSGAGGKDWSPVHAFCEADRVPCIFPNAPVPVDQPEDFYSLYLSGGLRLEAALIATHVTAHEPLAASGASSAAPTRAIAQIFREGSVGAAAADVLTADLAGSGISLRAVPVRADAGGTAVEDAVRQAGDADTLVLWLGQDDLSHLGTVPHALSRAYLSGRLSGLEEAPLPGPWRGRTLMAYPFDLPDKRAARMVYARDWLRSRGVPITDFLTQSDTWLACSILNETLHHIKDAFIPEYVVERVYEDLEHRFITAYYPRLSLAEHQRFASKGGYLVRFADASSHQVIAVGAWSVP